MKMQVYMNATMLAWCDKCRRAKLVTVERIAFQRENCLIIHLYCIKCGKRWKSKFTNGEVIK